MAAMQITLKHGDILDEDVDVLISTANPWLRLTGGVNGAILARGGQSVADELAAWLVPTGRFWVPAATVVRTGPGPLGVKCILHAVAIDGHYQSSPELVAETLGKALDMAVAEGARTVATPALACGYGNLELAGFVEGLRLVEPRALEELRVVMLRQDLYEELVRAF